MGRLEGKTAVITGASSGIGLASAKRFAAEGAQVVITGGRQQELDQAVKTIGGDVLAIQGDISNLSDLERLFDTVKSARGRIDVLFANAGLGALEPLGMISQDRIASWRMVVNFAGAALSASTLMISRAVIWPRGFTQSAAAVSGEI
jgi:NAD(P)-dependent dehydrogenase (short-subunit alcohol dehydrogenase family)